MKKRYFIVFLLMFLVVVSLGCQNNKAPQQASQVTEVNLPAAAKTIKANTAAYLRMNKQEKGRAYNIKLYPDRKVSIETTFKGEMLLLSPEGGLLKKITEDSKYYVCAKEGTYNIWIENNQVPREYYLVVKTYPKTQNMTDSNELPGTIVEKDGSITGVVDSKTDAVDYYHFQVKAEQNLSIFYTSPEIKVSLVNKAGDENPCPPDVKSDIYIVNPEEVYLKVTPKDGAVGVQYEIQLTRSK